MEHEDEDPVGAIMADAGRLFRRTLLWLVLGVVLLMVVANYGGMRESWSLGGPGARHAEDVDPLVRGGWDR